MQNVTNMDDMFSHCEKLTELNFLSFNISNVSSMIHMLSDWDDLQSLKTGKKFKFIEISYYLTGIDRTSMVNSSPLITFRPMLSIPTQEFYNNF